MSHDFLPGVCDIAYGPCDGQISTVITTTEMNTIDLDKHCKKTTAWNIEIGLDTYLSQFEGLGNTSLVISDTWTTAKGDLRL